MRVPLAVLAVGALACTRRPPPSLPANDASGAQTAPAWAPPPGFRVVAADDETLAWFGFEDTAPSWLFESDALLAFAVIRRQSLPPVPAPTDAIWRDAILVRELDQPPGLDPTLSYNYVAVWRDRSGLHLECGWVGKGERVEWYQLFTQRGPELVKTELAIHPSAPADVVEGWLDVAFGPRPPRPGGRRALAGERTPR